MGWRVVLASAVVAMTACGGGTRHALPPPGPASTSTVAPATTTTSTTDPDNMLTIGSHSARVAWLQGRLTSLGYRPGSESGVFTADTSSAVLAFQKREGLGRDGVAGPIVQAAITTPKGAGPHAGLPSRRIEIDLARQIAFVVSPGQPPITLNVSTGSGEHFRDPGTNADDIAYTPVGSFTVLRKIDKDVNAPLGVLHRPLYFYGGWAIHGSASVPGWPASHGCVRVSDDDADWLFPQTPVGTPVIIYDAKGSARSAPTGAAPGS